MGELQRPSQVPPNATGSDTALASPDMVSGLEKPSPRVLLLALASYMENGPTSPEEATVLQIAVSSFQTEAIPFLKI